MRHTGAAYLPYYRFPDRQHPPSVRNSNQPGQHRSVGIVVFLAPSRQSRMSPVCVAESYGTAHAELLAQFDLPADASPITPIKELELDSFSLDTLRIGLKE